MCEASRDVMDNRSRRRSQHGMEATGPEVAY